MTFDSLMNEYIQIVKKYMDTFGLYSIDISDLINSTQDSIKGLKNSKNGPTLKTLEAIANIFGLRHYQFGDPLFPIPKLEALPQATIDKINKRAEIGPPTDTQYNKLDLNDKVLSALHNVKDKNKFLPSEVFLLLDDETKTELGKSNRVTGLFSHELAAYVEKTGEKHKKEGQRGRPEEYYRVTSF